LTTRGLHYLIRTKLKNTFFLFPLFTKRFDEKKKKKKKKTTTKTTTIIIYE